MNYIHIVHYDNTTLQIKDWDVRTKDSEPIVNTLEFTIEEKKAYMADLNNLPNKVNLDTHTLYKEDLRSNAEITENFMKHILNVTGKNSMLLEELISERVLNTDQKERYANKLKHSKIVLGIIPDEFNKISNDVLSTSALISKLTVVELATLIVDTANIWNTRYSKGQQVIEGHRELLEYISKNKSIEELIAFTIKVDDWLTGRDVSKSIDVFLEDSRLELKSNILKYLI